MAGATCLASMLSVVACSSEEKLALSDGRVPLEVEVVGVQDTRTIIDGTALPDGSQYGIFAMLGGGTTDAVENGVNVQVDYNNGKSTLRNPVYIPDNADVPVYAYYPYDSQNSDLAYLRQIPVEASSQTDYLYGTSVDVNNNFSFANAYNPKVRIHFRHALARVRLNVRKADDNINSYKLPYVGLQNVLSLGWFDLYEGELAKSEGSINLLAKPSEYVLDTSEDLLTVDFLVLPMNTAMQSVTLGLGDNYDAYSLTAPMPATEWKSGQQYTYNVTIRDNQMPGGSGSLSISEATIAPWENTNQENIEVGDVNFAIAEGMDLGLSVEWATWNMGAMAPEDYGDYYYWGDPTGDATAFGFTSGNQPSTISNTEYDIAKAKWGGDWRLPTSSEINELIGNCVWQFVTLNGVNGYQVEGTNGNSIFIPLSGSPSNWQQGTSGYYMSGSSLDNGAGILFVDDSDSYFLSRSEFTEQLSVRPVRDKNY